MNSQTDKLGQPVTVGATVVASFTHRRSHHFTLAKVVGMTPQMAVLDDCRGADKYVFPRKCRFYNLVVVDKLVKEQRGGLNTAEIMGNG
jgi:hypothetical protein